MKKTANPPERSEEEIFDLVDETGRVVGQAARSDVHGNPSLLHRVVHVLVFDRSGRLFLQKRAEDKDVQPGRWDTSVGGHVDTGESVDDAVKRELSEELGIPAPPPTDAAGPELRFLYDYIHRNDYESELVSTFMCRWDGRFTLQRSELADGRFWELREIDCRAAEPDLFTPNFLDEFRRWQEAGAPLP